MTTRITLTDPVPTVSSTPCRDCVAAYTCVAEMGSPDTPLPVIGQAVCVWPAASGPMSLCARHHQVRADDLERRLAALAVGAVAA